MLDGALFDLVEEPTSPWAAAQDVFCWTRYADEAGEPIATILQRKEAERSVNGGRFLWGIGNAVGPALRQLVAQDRAPMIRFSAMRSKPALRDVAPAGVTTWSGGQDLLGRPYTVPLGHLITSSSRRRAHWALVCQSMDPLLETDQRIHAGQLRNLRSGNPVGASQVTCVVARLPELAESGAVYERGFSAHLVAPYLVRLTEGSTEAL